MLQATSTKFVRESTEIVFGVNFSDNVSSGVSQAFLGNNVVALPCLLDAVLSAGVFRAKGNVCFLS